MTQTNDATALAARAEEHRRNREYVARVRTLLDGQRYRSPMEDTDYELTAALLDHLTDETDDMPGSARMTAQIARENVKRWLVQREEGRR